MFYASDAGVSSAAIDNGAYHFSQLRRVPSARAVSNAVHSGSDEAPSKLSASKHSLLVMQVGQLLDHDLTLTPEMTTCSEECVGGRAVEEIDCCNLTASHLPPPKFCMPIEVPQDDEIFGARQ